MNTFLTITSICSGLLAFFSLAAMIVKPFREWVFGIEKRNEAQRCLLRESIVSIYYKNFEMSQLRRYEFESLCKLYSAYKNLGGNSFIDKLFDDMSGNWKVLPD